MWHLPRDTWHLTCDMWWRVNSLSKLQLSSSYALGVLTIWRSEGKASVSESINDKGVCRTALAIPGLVIIYDFIYYSILSTCGESPSPFFFLIHFWGSPPCPLFVDKCRFLRTLPNPFPPPDFTAPPNQTGDSQGMHPMTQHTSRQRTDITI